ncbi:ATP-binding protein [Sporosarcina sp. YIM B06819]|uniref:ATP-binding protein n=1 Tax=Sporosarcina sp. YIM B06819 TaxID=3081769 RepID=UPI00298BFEE0|nr:ATP-binding protein [Sporosarcina sp. YIM B06819]
MNKTIRNYTPKVNDIKEMFEVSCNFSKPLEVVREAISNAYDAGATNLHITAFRNEAGKLVLKFIDDGFGMGLETLIRNFWGLGYSDKGEGSTETIGYKSHGTMIYLRSEQIIMDTYHTTGSYRSQASHPLSELSQGNMFEFSAEELENPSGKRGTEITLIGFNQNVSEDFSHDKMKDYIYWFTKTGTFEKELGYQPRNFTVYLKGIRDEVPAMPTLFEMEYEACPIGHHFPEPTPYLMEVVREKRLNFFKHAVQKWTGKRTVSIHDEEQNEIEVEYEYVIYFEGDEVKKAYNPCIKRNGKNRSAYTYRVADRYGVYLSKDYIPLQNVNEWLPRVGEGGPSASQVLHGFINCQAIQLTSDRSSMASTTPLLANELRKSIYLLFKEIDRDLKNGIYAIKKNLTEILKEMDKEKNKKGKNKETEPTQGAPSNEGTGKGDSERFSTSGIQNGPEEPANGENRGGAQGGGSSQPGVNKQPGPGGYRQPYYQQDIDAMSTYVQGILELTRRFEARFGHLTDQAYLDSMNKKDKELYNNFYAAIRRVSNKML